MDLDTSSEQSMESRSGYVRMLRRPNVGLLFAGHTLSLLGDGLYFGAVLWLTQELTGSRVMMGVVAACRTAPLLVSFLAGIVADRLDKRRIMLVSVLSRALLVSLIPALMSMDLLKAWHLAAIALGLGSGAMLFYPARQAVVPELIPREELVYANSLFTLSAQLTQAAGFSIAGLVIGKAGTAPLFWGNAVLLVMSSIAIRALRLSCHGRNSLTGKADINLASEMREGLSFILRTKALTLMLPLVVVMNFVVVPLFVLMPGWVKEVLGKGPEAYGLLQTSHTGGMVIGSLLVGSLAFRFRRSSFVFWCLAIQSVFLFGFTQVRDVALSSASLLGMGVLDAMVVVVYMTYVQTLVPGQMMGRVFGAIETITQMVVPFGQAMGGLAGQALGLPLLYTVAGVARAAGSLVVALPAFRKTLDAAEDAEVDTQ